jgi:hypothetical protein
MSNMEWISTCLNETPILSPKAMQRARIVYESFGDGLKRQFLPDLDITKHDFNLCLSFVERTNIVGPPESLVWNVIR